jgi:glycosyltransferase involved in cell wall biosynthesis
MPRFLALTQSVRFGGDDTVLLALIGASAPGDDWTAAINRSHPGLPVYEAALAGRAELVPLDCPADGEPGAWGALRAARRLRGVVAAARPDAVLVSSGGFPPTALTIGFLLASRLAGAPRIVLAVHNDPNLGQGARRLWRGLRGRLAARLCDELVSVSADCAAKVSASCGRPVRVILNGAEDRGGPADPAALRRELGVPRDAFVIGAIGGLESRKGFMTLVEAFRLLPPGPLDRLVLIGAPAEDAEAGRLRDAAAEPFFAGRVLLAGYRERAWRFVSAFDVCALPSLRRESFGLLALDAMQARRPVVASRVGGLPEVVEDERTGLLVAPGDAGALAAALSRLRGDAPLRARLGESGRRRWTERFTAQRMAREYREMLVCSINEQGAP